MKQKTFFLFALIAVLTQSTLPLNLGLFGHSIQNIVQQVQQERRKSPGSTIDKSISNEIECILKQLGREAEKINQEIKYYLDPKKKGAISRTIKLLVEEIFRIDITSKLFDAQNASQQTLNRCKTKINRFLTSVPKKLNIVEKLKIANMKANYSDNLSQQSGSGKYFVNPYKGIFNKWNTEVFKIKIEKKEGSKFEVFIKVVLNEQNLEGNEIQMRSVVGMSKCTFSLDDIHNVTNKLIANRIDLGRFLLVGVSLPISSELIDQIEYDNPNDFSNFKRNTKLGDRLSLSQSRCPFSNTNTKTSYVFVETF